jgi:hypothetical protein
MSARIGGLNGGPPEYEARMLAIRSRISKELSLPFRLLFKKSDIYVGYFKSHGN